MPPTAGSSSDRALQRRGKAIHLTAANPRYLNAEDQTTLDAMETAVDVAILDPATEIAVLRGGPVEHPKYATARASAPASTSRTSIAARSPFSGTCSATSASCTSSSAASRGRTLPDDVHGFGIEKPWVAAVDTFAIGGHCQLLLCMDYVLAAADAFMTLPARKEGIIPGFANLRLPRFTGDRIARQAIQDGRQLTATARRAG